MSRLDVDWGLARSRGAQLFWVFVLCSVGGLVIEEIAHLVQFGALQDRAGLLWGPFSPVYGVGGACIAAASWLLEKRPLPLKFLAFALIGGIVEFAASALMERFFGVEAWEYTGSWLSVGGRTNGAYMIAWGILGTALCRFVMPHVGRLTSWIARKVPVLAQGALAVFLAVDVALTCVALDCWDDRRTFEPTTRVEAWCAEVFDDDYMAERFQTMTFKDVADASRAEAEAEA